MTRSTLLATLIYSQAAALLAAGIVTIWWSENLMTWLIYLVGEERALGAGNVIHQEAGGVLLTNPSAMVRWMIPFWVLGAIQITSSLSLVALWACLTRKQTQP